MTYATPPGPGPYWRPRQLPSDVALETVRAGRSREFDNSARLRSEDRVPLRWDRFASRVAPDFYFLLDESELGTPPRHPLCVDGLTYMASVSSIEFAAMASALVPAIREARTVIEIGGGYGGLASAVLRSHAYLDEWAIVDIPGTARVARWYLAGNPRARVLDVDDIALLGPADVVVQTRGFMEMSPEELCDYFERIQSGALLRPGGLFWTINRREKVSRFADYPFDQRWEVLRSEKWPEGDMIEVLLRRTDVNLGDVAERLGLRAA